MRGVRRLGFTLAASIAVSLAFASAAHAVSFRSEVATTTIKGTGLNTWVFNSKFGEVKCTSVNYAGTMKGSEVKAGVFVSSSMTTHPEFSGCKALGFNATVSPTACDFAMLGLFAAPPLWEFAGAFIVACAAINVIHIVAAGGLCSINIPAQEGAGNVDFSNEGSGSSRTFRMGSTVNKVEYEGIGGFCSGAGTGGTISAEASFKGSSGETQKGIWIE